MARRLPSPSPSPEPVIRTSSRSRKRAVHPDFVVQVVVNKRRRFILDDQPLSSVSSRSRKGKGKENVPVEEDSESESDEEAAEEDEDEGDEEASVESDVDSPTPEEPQEEALDTFSLDDDLESTARHYPTPLPTPTKPTLPKSLYASARTYLSTSISLPQALTFVSRQKELEEIEAFLATRFPSSGSGSRDTEPGTLYVAGLPGLGKTAALTHCLVAFKARQERVQVWMENCSTLPRSIVDGNGTRFWEKLGEELGLGDRLGLEGVERALKEEGGKKKGKKFLLVLDEIDALLPSSSTATTIKSKLTLLQNLFRLASLSSSPLTLIGIANSLDLTSRHLSSFSPKVVHFEPYKSVAIMTIIRQRLGLIGEEGEKLVDEKALMLFSRRIENVEGDLRLAFSIIRKSLGIVENRMRERYLASDSDEGTDVDEKMANLKMDEVDVVKIPDILAAFRESGITSNDPLAGQIAALSLNPRLILVSILLTLSKPILNSPASSSNSKNKKVGGGGGGVGSGNERKETTLMECFNTYREALKEEEKRGGLAMRVLNQGEFTSTLDILSSEALISLYSPSNSPNKNKGKKSFSSMTNPTISLPLSSTSTKSDLIEALKTVPGKSEEESTSNGVGIELMRLSKNLFAAEERRLGRILKSEEREKEREEVMHMVPRGWERDNVDWLGKKVR